MHLTMIIVPMDVPLALEILLTLLLTGLTVRGLWQVMRHKPLFSVANARALVFVGGMLAGVLYFWISFLKPFIS